MAARLSTNAVPDWISGPYPHQSDCLVSFPKKYILQVTINRPEAMNCLSLEASSELGLLWRWYDSEPGLRCAVFTAAGDKAFCSGMDLKQRLGLIEAKATAIEMPSGGFAGMTNRNGIKPIIVACNGHAHGGGMEISLNADVIFASPNATFRLPDPLRGTVALLGVLPRAFMQFGNHRTMDLILSARSLSADEAVSWGLVKEVVPLDQLVDKAVAYAELIASMSPDSVIISRREARAAYDAQVRGTAMKAVDLWEGWLSRSPNFREGLAAFKAKRKPNWVNSSL